MKRTACGQCHGTDTQYECERGQCYAEECLRQQAYEQAREAWEMEQSHDDHQDR